MIHVPYEDVYSSYPEVENFSRCGKDLVGLGSLVVKQGVVQTFCGPHCGGDTVPLVGRGTPLDETPAQASRSDAYLPASGCLYVRGPAEIVAAHDAVGAAHQPSHRHVVHPENNGHGNPRLNTWEKPAKPPWASIGSCVPTDLSCPITVG